MAIVWFTDEDRQRMCDNEHAIREERAVLDLLDEEYATEVTGERPLTPAQLWVMNNLQLDPSTRRGRPFGHD